MLRRIGGCAAADVTCLFAAGCTLRVGVTTVSLAESSSYGGDTARSGVNDMTASERSRVNITPAQPAGLCARVCVGSCPIAIQHTGSGGMVVVPVRMSCHKGDCILI